MGGPCVGPSQGPVLERCMTDLVLEAPKREARVMGMIGFVHGISHFFQLVLPPLFPFMRDGFNVDFKALGFLMAVYFSVSAVMQVAAGFIVDRLGAQRVLPI